MKYYIFGSNYNPITKKNETELYSFTIPANNEDEAWEKLGVISKVVTKNAWLNDIQEYN